MSMSSRARCRETSPLLKDPALPGTPYPSPQEVCLENPLEGPSSLSPFTGEGRVPWPPSRSRFVGSPEACPHHQAPSGHTAL